MMKLIYWALAGAAAIQISMRVPMSADPNTNRLWVLGLPGAVAVYGLYREGGPEAVAAVAGAWISALSSVTLRAPVVVPGAPSMPARTDWFYGPPNTTVGGYTYDASGRLTDIMG